LRCKQGFDRLRARSGFGLGLSIVQTLVNNHKGEVSLHDRDPHGLIARVTLPRAFEGNEGGD
jgi:signal transduction histidine kinase